MKLLALAISVLALVLPASAAIFDWEDKPSGDHVMAFRLFVPDDLKKAKAIVILTTGINGDGRDMANDSAWQDFARRNQCLLLACSMQGVDGGSYYDAEIWSGKVLLEGLKKMAKESGHEEFATLPFLLWGYSAGGQFNYQFACWKPERTLAFIANKGGYYNSEASPSVRKVPALWICGAKDTEVRITNITNRYRENRKRGALWGLAMEPNEEHGMGRSKELGMVFLEDALKLRLDGFGKPRTVAPAEGWLGDLTTHEIAKCTADDSAARAKTWLPGEATATLWRQIVSGTPDQP